MTTSWYCGGGPPTVMASSCWSFMPSDYGGLAEQRFRLGEEVRQWLDLVLRAEHVLARPFGGLEQQVDARLARKVLDQQREVVHDAGRGDSRVDLDRHLFALGDGLERRDLHREQLRLPLLLVVDAALDDQDAVHRAELARLRVDGVEDDELAAAGDVVEPHEDHRLALLRRQVLERGDDAADGDDLAVAAALDVGERAVGLAAQLVADRVQRVLGDVEAERVLLQSQQLGLLELLAGDLRVLDLEHRLLAEERLLLARGAGAERGFERAEHAHSRPPGRVERAALDERVERPLVRGGVLDALAEFPDRLERPALLARADDRARRRLSDVLYGGEAEADLLLDDGEVELRRVHVRRQHLDPHLVARVDVERHAVLRAHDGRDQRGHVLARVVRAHVRGAVGDERVAGGVGLVEGVVLGSFHVLPELVRDARRRAGLGAALEELLLEGGHQRVDLLADRLAQVVGLARREAGDLLRDLQVLLLVDARPVRDAGDRLEPRVDVGDLLLAVLAARVDRDVLHRARPVERDERDQILEDGRLDLLERLAHARRLELEDAGRVALREHPVDLLVVERQLRPVDAVADELLCALEDVEVAEAEEVHLQEAERLDVAAVELRNDFLVGSLLLERDVLRQRPVADHHAGGVDRVRADEPFERLGEIDNLARCWVRVVLRFQLLTGLEARAERLP